MQAILPYLTEISLALITIACVTILVRWQNNPDNNFDLTDCLLGEDRKVSLYKIGQASALIVSTWAFIIMVQKNQMTEYYFYGYMGVWSGINLAKNIFGKAPDGSTSKT